MVVQKGEKTKRLFLLHSNSLDGLSSFIIIIIEKYKQAKMKKN